MCLAGCRAKQNDENTIFVTIAPLKPLVEEIVGDDYAIEVLVPSGASPETFEPTPRQFTRLNKSRMIVGTGLITFEQSLLARLSDRDKIVDLSHGIELLGGCCSHGHHHHAHGVDPHIWCSPKSLRVMANNLYRAIKTTLPESKKYEANYLALCKKVEVLDAEVQALCDTAQCRYFIIFHPALSYLARDYGLEQIAIEHEGKEASVKRLSAIIDRARRDDVPKVLYQSEFPRHSVEIVASDIGAEVVEIDPLSENVFDNIRNITRCITTR